MASAARRSKASKSFNRLQPQIFRCALRQVSLRDAQQRHVGRWLSPLMPISSTASGRISGSKVSNSSSSSRPRSGAPLDAICRTTRSCDRPPPFLHFGREFLFKRREVNPREDSDRIYGFGRIPCREAACVDDRSASGPSTSIMDTRRSQSSRNPARVKRAAIWSAAGCGILRNRSRRPDGNVTRPQALRQ